MEIKQADVVLCKFYFSDLKKSKNRPVLILKDNLPFNDFVAIPRDRVKLPESDMNV